MALPYPSTQNSPNQHRLRPTSIAIPSSPFQTAMYPSKRPPLIRDTVRLATLDDCDLANQFPTIHVLQSIFPDIMKRDTLEQRESTFAEFWGDVDPAPTFQVSPEDRVDSYPGNLSDWMRPSSKWTRPPLSPLVYDYKPKYLRVKGQANPYLPPSDFYMKSRDSKTNGEVNPYFPNLTYLKPESQKDTQEFHRGHDHQGAFSCFAGPRSVNIFGNRKPEDYKIPKKRNPKVEVKQSEAHRLDAEPKYGRIAAQSCKRGPEIPLTGYFAPRKARKIQYTYYTEGK